MLSVSLVTLVMEEGADELSVPLAPNATAPATRDLAVTAMPPAATRQASAPAERSAPKLGAAPVAAARARAPEDVMAGRAAVQTEKRSHGAQLSEPSAGRRDMAIPGRACRQRAAAAVA